MRGIPIELSASVTLAPGNNQNVVADLGQIQMDHRTPIEVDEIRFALKGTAGSDPRGTTFADLEVGPYRLTDGAVPIWAMSPHYNYNNQLISGEGVAFTRWVLPRPMVMPSGFVFRPRFSLLPGSGATVDIEVSVVGRSLIDGKYPRATRVPYVSAWTPGADDKRNPETTLRNGLDKDLLVHRFVGHNGDYATGKDTEAGGSYGDVGIWSVMNPTVELRTSVGYAITSKPTPFTLLFPAQSQVLPVEQILKRNDHYDVFLGTAPSTNCRPCISFVASREEQI